MDFDGGPYLKLVIVRPTIFPTFVGSNNRFDMRLSDLKTGQSAVILKVLGHGGFRRRIMEMGFVRGKRVEVLQTLR